MRLRMTITVLALVGLLGTAGVFAQQNQTKPANPSGALQTRMMGGNMGPEGQQMMAMHNRMMADMKAMDAQLDQKVAAMNAAKGDARIDAMEAVINEMAAQRKQMMATMTNMQGQMRAQSGNSAMRQPSAPCPMMQGGAH